MKCFNCGDDDHLVKMCMWKDLPCIRGCPEKMTIFWSSQQSSRGCRFLRCKGQPNCQAFKWIDDPKKMKRESEASSSNQNRDVKVTVEENGKKITFEGQVSDVIELMNKKLSM